MKLRILVIALTTALGSGCASLDNSRLTYQIAPDSTIRHGMPNAQSYYHLGRYYQGQKRFELAETAYKKSIEINANQEDAYNALGSLYAERGDLDRSVQQFEKALSKAPGKGYLYNNLGFAYYLQGRLSEAYEALRQALTKDAFLERGWANLERIATERNETLLIAAVKSRRIESLPPTLLASAPPAPATPKAAAPIPGKTAVAPPPPSVGASPAPTVGKKGTPTTAPEIGTSVSAVNSPTVTVKAMTAENDDQRLQDGKFMLASTKREIVNLAEPVSTETMRAEPVLAEPVLAEPIRIAKAESATPVSKASANSSTTKAFDFKTSKVKVEVTNANGVTGFAKKFSAQLRTDNIPVSRITNYISYALKETVIEYQPGHEDAARAMAEHLQINARLVPAKFRRLRSDIRILLGQNINFGDKKAS